eukprot:Colp12_sorted_trinity150504_noHs@18305
MASNDDWDDVPQDEDEDDRSKQKSFIANLKSNAEGEKDADCEVCHTKVPFHQQTRVDGKAFHKTCFKCDVCHKTLAPGNYAGLEGKFYCKPHFKQSFLSKGNYSEGFGHEDPKKKWSEHKHN